MNVLPFYHVLLVEDEPGDANLIQHHLRTCRDVRFDTHWVSTIAEAKQCLQDNLPDIVLLDLSLPDSVGLDTVHGIRQTAATVPIIVLTGHDDIDFALQTLDSGAQDYLVKGDFDTDGLARVIRYAISRAKLEQRLRDSEERMKLALSGANLGLWDWDLLTGKVIFNDIWARMLGYTLDEIEPRISTWEQLIHPDERAHVDACVQAHLRGETRLYQCEHRLKHKKGHWLWVYDIGRVLEWDRQGQPIRAVGIHQDISQRKAAEARDYLLVSALEAVSHGVIITDTEGNIEWCNQGFEALSGYRHEEAVGKKPEQLLKSGQQDQSFYQALWGAILSGENWQGELINKRKNGELYHEELTIAPVKDENGIIQHFVGIKHDISERKRLEAELLEMATTDPLTGLPNRRHFMMCLDRELSRMRRNEAYRVAVLMLDLDHFKNINDSFGHAVGDEVLKHFSGLLSQAARKVDMVGRLGGEEFSVFLPDTDIRAAYTFAERFRQQLQDTPFVLSDNGINVTVSIGVAAMMANDKQADSALIRADQALYRSKESGRNRVEIEEGN